MTLKELRQQRSTKAARGKAALTEHNTLAAKADRTAEEDAKLANLATELDALESEVAGLDAKISAEEATARRGALFATSTTSLSTPARAAFDAARTVNEEDNAGFAHMADFANAVRNAYVGGGVVDPRLAALPSNYNQNGGSSGEGFMVPAAMSERIWDVVFSEFDLLAMCSPEPTASNVVQLIKDETTPWGSAGVQANWRGEGSQMSASKLATKGVQVPLHELYAFAVATDELTSDAPRLASRLTVQAGRAINWKASDAIMWGDGVGKLVGFMASAALVTQAKESGQAGVTVNATNVAKMLSRLLTSAGSRAFWIANPDVLPQLMVMTIGDRVIWTPPNEGFKGAPGGYLLGKPVMFTEHAKTLGTVGDIVLMDPDGYYAATKSGGIDFASSIHLFFDYNASAFRWTFRVGGQPILSAPVDPANGSNTKSHFVALATRA